MLQCPTPTFSLTLQTLHEILGNLNKFYCVAKHNLMFLQAATKIKTSFSKMFYGKVVLKKTARSSWLTTPNKMVGQNFKI